MTSFPPGARGVLAADQLGALDAAVATLNANQLAWASGYLAGIAAAGSRAAPAGENTADLATAASAKPELAIVFGSQTGHAEAIAEDLHQAAQAAGFGAKLLNMADLNARQLAKERWVALVVSTHGEGDPPDDAMLLLEQLRKPRAPRLEDMQLSVLALGDSSYAQFCQTGRDFEASLVALGASVVAPMVECDVDYQASAQSWREHVIAEYRRANGADDTRPALHVVAPPPAVRDGTAVVTVNQQITGEHSSKRVHHLELAFDAPLDYQPGDSLGVRVPNPSGLVQQLLADARLQGADPVTWSGQSRTLEAVLTDAVEITRISGAFLEAYAALPGVDGLAEALRDDASRRELLDSGHIGDVVIRYPHQADAQAFVECLRPLQPRLYSIASAPTETPDEIHLVVAEVAFDSANQRRYGAASQALVEDTPVDATLSVFVEANTRFRLPDDDTVDVIMIGPGTGVAPFRSFVQERLAREASGRHWLFFGDRTFREDFLYQSEWQAHLRSGALDRIDLAFSRDQSEKIYVQDRLRERADEILDWLDRGAYLYVCGDAASMAPDVHAALIEILARRVDGDVDKATEALDKLRRERRYLRDVY